MTIPDYQACMLPLLKSLANGETKTTRTLNQEMADYFQLTEEERKQKLPSGKQLVMPNRCGWARTYLRKAGLLASPKRGTVRITDLGIQVLKEGHENIDNKILLKYNSFKDFINYQDKEETQKSSEIQTEKSEETPHERMEAAYNEVNHMLREQILEQILNCSPEFFETLVLEVVVKMGYGGNLKDAAEAIGRSGDSGIDGVIKQDPLGLDMIYLQAKRWKEAPVGRPEIQKFAGALLGKQANKGIFITASRFTPEAREYAESVNAKIILINGQELANLMMEYNVGVQKLQTYTLKRIDLDYFEES